MTKQETDGKMRLVASGPTCSKWAADKFTGDFCVASADVKDFERQSAAVIVFGFPKSVATQRRDYIVKCVNEHPQLQSDRDRLVGLLERARPHVHWIHGRALRADIDDTLAEIKERPR